MGWHYHNQALPQLEALPQLDAQTKVTCNAIHKHSSTPDHQHHLIALPVCTADAKFQNTGLERSQALAEDIAWYTEQFKLPQPVIADSGPGMQYAKHLREIAANDPQDFVCHFYNYYFAHTAGGRMIGKSVSRHVADIQTACLSRM